MSPTRRLIQLAITTIMILSSVMLSGSQALAACPKDIDDGLVNGCATDYGYYIKGGASFPINRNNECILITVQGGGEVIFIPQYRQKEYEAFLNAATGQLGITIPDIPSIDWDTINDGANSTSLTSIIQTSKCLGWCEAGEQYFQGFADPFPCNGTCQEYVGGSYVNDSPLCSNGISPNPAPCPVRCKNFSCSGVNAADDGFFYSNANPTVPLVWCPHPALTQDGAAVVQPQCAAGNSCLFSTCGNGQFDAGEICDKTTPGAQNASECQNCHCLAPYGSDASGGCLITAASCSLDDGLSPAYDWNGRPSESYYYPMTCGFSTPFLWLPGCRCYGCSMTENYTSSTTLNCHYSWDPGNTFTVNQSCRSCPDHISGPTRTPQFNTVQNMTIGWDFTTGQWIRTAGNVQTDFDAPDAWRTANEITANPGTCAPLSTVNPGGNTIQCTDGQTTYYYPIPASWDAPIADRSRGKIYKNDLCSGTKISYSSNKKYHISIYGKPFYWSASKNADGSDFTAGWGTNECHYCPRGMNEIPQGGACRPSTLCDYNGDGILDEPSIDKCNELRLQLARSWTWDAYWYKGSLEQCDVQSNDPGYTPTTYTIHGLDDAGNPSTTNVTLGDGILDDNKVFIKRDWWTSCIPYSSASYGVLTEDNGGMDGPDYAIYGGPLPPKPQCNVDDLGQAGNDYWACAPCAAGWNIMMGQVTLFGNDGTKAGPINLGDVTQRPICVKECTWQTPYYYTNIGDPQPTCHTCPKSYHLLNRPSGDQAVCVQCPVDKPYSYDAPPAPASDETQFCHHCPQVTQWDKDNLGTGDYYSYFPVNDGTISQAKIVEYGLNWADITNKLTSNSWADQVSATEIKLKDTLDFDATTNAMIAVFGRTTYDRLLEVMMRSRTPLCSISPTYCSETTPDGVLRKGIIFAKAKAGDYNNNDGAFPGYFHPDYGHRSDLVTSVADTQNCSCPNGYYYNGNFGYWGSYVTLNGVLTLPPTKFCELCPGPGHLDINGDPIPAAPYFYDDTNDSVNNPTCHRCKKSDPSCGCSGNSVGSGDTCVCSIPESTCIAQGQYLNPTTCECVTPQCNGTLEPGEECDGNTRVTTGGYTYSCQNCSIKRELACPNVLATDPNAVYWDHPAVIAQTHGTCSGMQLNNNACTNCSACSNWSPASVLPIYSTSNSTQSCDYHCEFGYTYSGGFCH